MGNILNATCSEMVTIIANQYCLKRTVPLLSSNETLQMTNIKEEP
jgi:hypothetical protein